MTSSILPQRFAYAAVGLLMAGTAFVMHHRQHGFKAPFEPGHMPVCDSSTVRQLFKQAIEDAPDAKKGDVKVLKLGGVADTTKAMDEIRSKPGRIAGNAWPTSSPMPAAISSASPSIGATTTRTRSTSTFLSCRSEGAIRHAAFRPP